MSSSSHAALEASNTALKVAAIQMVSGFSLNQNLEQAAELIDQASNQGAELILLPENCLMFSASRFLSLATSEKDSQKILDFLSETSKRYGCYLVAGSVPVVSSRLNKVFSASIVFSPTGEELARYHKIHLFDVDIDDDVGAYRESDTIEAGDSLSYFDIGKLRVGLAICYDLRFPELFRALSKQGCHVLLLPAAFTQHTGALHWEVLLRARAIENQCYVLAANQGGEHVGESGKVRKTYGHSMLIDAQGSVLNELSTGKGICVGAINLNELNQLRSQMPVLSHRKLDV